MPDRVEAVAEKTSSDAAVRLIVACLGGAVAALGVAVLFGWWLGMDSLTRISPDLTPMKPNAAVCNVLAGIGLVTWMRGTPKGALFAGVALLVLGGLTLAQDVVGVDLRIDRVLLPADGDADAVAPGRMAQMTAAAAIATGAGLLALVRGRWALVHVFAGTVWVIGYVALLGYLYGVAAFYEVGVYTQMAVHTAAAVCLIGLALELSVADHGLGVLARDRGVAGQITRTLIPAVVVVIPLLGGLVLRGQRRGWYQPAMTAAVLAATVGVVGTVLTLRAATAALRSDEQQQRARRDLEALTDTLEHRVTERTQKVHDAGRDLAAVFDAAPVGMVRLDKSGSCFSVNAEWCRMSGSDVEQPLGQGWLDSIHPGDRPGIVQGLESGSEQEWTCRMLTPAGPRMTACAVRAVNGLGHIATFVDVHERTEALRALDDARARFAAAFRASSLGVALVALDGTVLEANERLADLTGGSVDELVGQPMAALLDEGYAPVEEQIRAGLLSGHRTFTRYECRLRGRPGDVIWVQANVALVDSSLDAPQYFLTELEDITARRLAEDQLAYVALHDPLTSLPNRLLLLDRLDQALRRTRRLGGSVAVLVVDLDRFKALNDRLGRHAGDQVLRVVADRLRKAARPTDTVSRLGGDKFVVVSEELEAGEDALPVAERCRMAIHAPMVRDGPVVRLDASVGIAVSGVGADSETLLRDAEAAMYEAKSRGRARCVTFDEGMRTRLTRWIDLGTGLSGAAERGELSVRYQPIVQLDTGLVAGFEALARWQPPDRQPVMPDDFIPVAEQTGLILEIGERILRDACSDAVLFQCGARGLRMSVNVSAQQLLASDFAATVRAVLLDTGLDPSGLSLEFTESVLVEAAAAAENLQELRRLGVHVAIDDFGIGYSSLAYLRRFPVDVLKIDGVFVDGLPGSARDISIVTGIVHLGQSIGSEVICEGVERPEQVETLLTLGCRFGQGFIFGRGGTAAEVLAAQP